MSTEREYVLGTHDDEIERLGMQHRVWRPKVTDAWHRAGFRVGQMLIDIGCGPGYAAIDLAEIVESSGKVLAVDQSARFLSALEVRRDQRGLSHLETLEANLDLDPLPQIGADGAFCRWVLSFVSKPREVLEKVAGSLRSGGTFVAFEYYDYDAYNVEPTAPEFREFKEAVVKSWRAGGGEPDIGLKVPKWLREVGFEVKSIRVHHEMITKRDYFWQWPWVWEQVGLQRLVDLGYLTPARGQAISLFFEGLQSDPHAMVFTPSVMEIIAVKK
ncbi:MAG: class I SAM-dependent methyltransferase [Armatimonadetes bacterium]|nr:class I SAM-dependent methyltransferase [Armatimonadota bacterium]